MDAALQSFLNHLKFEKRYSQNTLFSYQTDIEQLIAFIKGTFGTVSIEDVSQTIIRSWLASLKGEDMSSRSIRRKISALKSFFKFQMRTGVLQNSPMTNIVSPKISKRLPVYVEEKDIHQLFASIQFPDTWKGKTEKLLLMIFYQTGLRLSELINLKEKNIDFGSRTIKVLGKGNKERILPISHQLASALSTYRDQKRSELENFSSEYLLVKEDGKQLYAKYAYLIVNKYLSQVTTIEKKSPHVLRHSFATHLSNNGAELNSIKELLGHSSLAATQIYTHNTIEKLKEIHKKAHPKA